MNPLPERLRRRVLDTWLLYTVLLVNLAGTLFGFYYYLPQLASTDPLLWIFVPDSPLATLAFSASILLYRMGRRERALETFAFVSNFVYGLWTPFVLLFYSSGFLETTSITMYSFLIFSHLGMALQAFLILDYSFFDIQSFAVAAFVSVTDNLVDYTLGTHSTLHTGGRSVLPAGAVALTLTFLGLLLYLVEVGPERHRPSDLLRYLE